ASVEAARAGEQGRGFAVVATEVRNLAGRSATAAKEIKELIQDSLKKVQAGASLVNESGETLGEITDGVTRVSDIISEIDAASSEQTTGIDQVNRAITSMDEMVQQNALLAEKTSIASGSMRDKAQELKSLMQFFKVNSGMLPPEEPMLAATDAGMASAGMPEEPAMDSMDNQGHGLNRYVIEQQNADESDEWEEF
ncbi:MAG: chemotaxis protein, partial [Gammaproteobacteria bacterium]|nr:chemotaxis protein [Gammaproteobacteria bacterium]